MLKNKFEWNRELECLNPFLLDDASKFGLR